VAHIEVSFAALHTGLYAEVQGIPQILTTLGFVRCERLTRGEQMIDDGRHPRPRSVRVGGIPDRWAPSTPAIVARALFGIAQDGVGFVEAAEPGLSLGLVRVQIWMQAHGHLMVRPLDLLRTCIATDAEDVVIIRLPQG
jgi:hypothetical protein